MIRLHNIDRGDRSQEERLRHPLRLFATIALCASALNVAAAQGAAAFGVGLDPLDLTADLNVTLPLFEAGAARHAVRADLTYSFTGLPGLSATYVLSDPGAADIRTYVGAGAGVAFLTSPGLSAVLSAHALAGANVHLTGPLGAYGEVVVAGNALATGLRLALGLSYEPGGWR
jgi:hypothetical protein